MTDLSWFGTGEWEQTARSFLFGLSIHGATSPIKIPVRPGRTHHAMLGDTARGPTFGGGYDLFVASDANVNAGSYSNPYCYTCPGFNDGFLAGKRNFEVVEYECFSIGPLVPTVDDSVLLLPAFEGSNGVNQLMGWIGDSNPHLPPATTKLRLMFRASRNGWNAKDFHRQVLHADRMERVECPAADHRLAYFFWLAPIPSHSEVWLCL
jgi:hypothetical protein